MGGSKNYRVKVERESHFSVSENILYLATPKHFFYFDTQRKRERDRAHFKPEKNEKRGHQLTENQKQFVESYARSREKLTQAEWAKRFRVTRRTIVNWLANPEIRENIENIRKEVVVVIGREFVEQLSPEEKTELLDLLNQQQRIDDEPGSGLGFKELKEIMIRKAFCSNIREVQNLIAFFEDLANVFKGIQNDYRKNHVVI